MNRKILIPAFICLLLLRLASAQSILPDPSFGQSGRVNLDFGNTTKRIDQLADVQVQPDGKIILMGNSSNGNNIDFSAVRLKSDGSADSTFDKDGKMLIPVGKNSNDNMSAGALYVDGKILMTGASYISAEARWEYAAVRLRTDGIVDSSFGANGKLIFPVNNGTSTAIALAIQPNGKAILAGYTGLVASQNHFSLVRLNYDGSFDNSFDGDGKKEIFLGSATSNSFITDIIVQPDGKILLIGNLSGGVVNMVFVRLNSDGSFDTNFNGTGQRIFTNGVYDPRMTLQADGKILVIDQSNNNFAVMRFNSDGTVDNTFDSDGKQVLTSASSTSCYTISIQPDGKIIAAGTIVNGSRSDYEVIRLNTDGSFDTSFDTDGKLSVSVGPLYDYPISIALQSDGKIVVAGYSIIINTVDDDFSAIRINSDGSLDNTFDSNGKCVIPVGTNYDSPSTVCIQPDGKTVMIGSSHSISGVDNFSFARLNTNGSLDNTFGQNGKLILPVGNFSNDANTGGLLQPDGKIIAVGYSTNTTNLDFSIVRLNTDGSLDNTFDSDGKQFIPIGPQQDYATCTALQPDGKILIGGYSYTASDYEFSLVRLNSDGSLDNTFDSDGKIILHVSSAWDFLTSILVQSDGKILASGSSGITAVAVRLNSDGSLDNTFNTTGVQFIPFGTNNYSHALCSTLDQDGKILLGGYEEDPVKGDLFIVIRLNQDGNIDSTFNNSGRAIIYDSNTSGVISSMVNKIFSQPDGKILVAGTLSRDFALFRLNGDGSQDTQFNQGVPVLDLSYGDLKSAAFTPDSQLVLAGYLEADFSAVKLLMHPSAHAVTGTTTALIESKNQSSAIRIFPNPSSGLFFIESDEKIINITVMDEKGQIEIMKSNEVNCSMEGLLLINIKTDKNSYTRKVLMIK